MGPAPRWGSSTADQEATGQVLRDPLLISFWALVGEGGTLAPFLPFLPISRERDTCLACLGLGGLERDFALNRPEARDRGY